MSRRAGATVALYLEDKWPTYLQGKNLFQPLRGITQIITAQVLLSSIGVATMYTLNIPLLPAISSIAYLGGVFARLMISHRSLFSELSGYAIPVHHHTVTY